MYLLMEVKLEQNEVLYNIPINNPEIIELLEEWSEFLHTNYDTIKKHISLSRHETHPGAGVEHSYLEHIRSKGAGHDGFPEMDHMYNIRPDFLKYRVEVPEAKALADSIRDAYTSFNNNMCTTLGIRRNALCALYPPNGYIGWHNNANASSYNLIFTYSSEGDGYWEHVNPYTNKIERIQDVKGWQCKASYFGSYSENNPTSLVYHSAKCGESGFRATVSWIFDREHKEWWLESLEEIKSD